MTERQQEPSRSGEGQVGSAPPLPPPIKILSEQTIPVQPVPAIFEGEPTLLGFPAEFVAPVVSRAAPGDAPPSPETGHGRPAAGPDSTVHLVVVRRAEPVGGVALVLAGVAAGASLELPWWRAAGATGLLLVHQGVVILGSGVPELGRSGLWEPVVVVLGGGALLLLGLLLFRPARSHRLVGVVALLVALAAAAGVVVPLADANWSTAGFRPGMWCAVAVASLGGLGALKAMLTAPVVTVRPH